MEREVVVEVVASENHEGVHGPRRLGRVERDDERTGVGGHPRLVRVPDDQAVGWPGRRERIAAVLALGPRAGHTGRRLEQRRGGLRGLRIGTLLFGGLLAPLR